jgi:hypothetical protein
VSLDTKMIQRKSFPFSFVVFLVLVILFRRCQNATSREAYVCKWQPPSKTLTLTVVPIAVRLWKQVMVMSIRLNHFNLLHVVYQDGDEMWIKRHIKTSQRLSEIKLLDDYAVSVTSACEWPNGDLTADNHRIKE